MNHSDYDIPGVDLHDDEYTVEQSLIRNKYAAYDKQGDVVVRGKQKLLKMKEQFPFVDAEGNEVFEVKASGILDIAGDYALSDARTGEEIVILDNDWRSSSWTTTTPSSRTPGRSGTRTPRPNSRRSTPVAPS